jgi:hypothetical protein
MTRVSCNSFQLLLLAAIPLCASIGVARADIQQSFNFSGVLATPINGGTSVTGQFTIDFTTDMITAFDFSAPFGTLSPASTTGVSDFVAANPMATFTELFFIGPAGNQIVLDFESPLSAFDGSSFYTGPIEPTGGGLLAAEVACPSCTPVSSTFSSGSATLVPSAVPEPKSALLLIGVLLFTVCAIRRKAKPVGSH